MSLNWALIFKYVHKTQDTELLRIIKSTTGCRVTENHSLLVLTVKWQITLNISVINEKLLSPNKILSYINSNKGYFSPHKEFFWKTKSLNLLTPALPFCSSSLSLCCGRMFMFWEFALQPQGLEIFFRRNLGPGTHLSGKSGCILAIELEKQILVISQDCSIQSKHFISI